MPEFPIPGDGPVPAEVTDRDVYISRTFDAPRAIVWRFFTEGDLLAQWFGPHAFTAPAELTTIDLRVGGVWQLSMVGADGAEHRMRATIRELREPEYLELAWYEGEYAADAEPTERLRLTFHDHGDRTRLTLHQGPFADDHFLEDTRAGWQESFDELAEAAVVLAGAVAQGDEEGAR